MGGVFLESFFLGHDTAAISAAAGGCAVLLVGGLLLSCAHCGERGLRLIGPRSGSLGRSPAQPGEGLGILTQHGS